MSDRVPSYTEQQAWRREEHDFFRHIGDLLQDVIPTATWHQLSVDEGRRRFEEAADLLRRKLDVKRKVPLVWVSIQRRDS